MNTPYSIYKFNFLFSITYSKTILLFERIRPLKIGVGEEKNKKSLKLRFKNDGAKVGFIYGYIHGFFGQNYNNTTIKENKNRPYRDAYVTFYELGYCAGKEDSRKQFENIASAIDPGQIALIVEYGMN